MNYPNWLIPEEYQIWLTPQTALFGSDHPRPFDKEVLEQFLYECDSKAELEGFVQESDFGISTLENGIVHPQSLELEARCRIARDARRLMLLVISLMRLVDGDEGCTREDLSNLGVRACNCPGLTDESANVYVVLESYDLMKYLRECVHANALEIVLFNRLLTLDMTPEELQKEGLLGEGSRFQMPSVAPVLMPSRIIKEKRMFLEEQRNEVAEYSDDESHPVIGFYGGNFPEDDSDCSDVVMRLIAGVIKRCRGRLEFLLMPRSSPLFSGNDSWSKLWSTLARSLNDSYATSCKCCGKPFLAHRKKGKRREYCSAKCRSRIIRTRRYWRMTREEHIDPSTAARAARVSAGLAEEIIHRSPALF